MAKTNSTVTAITFTVAEMKRIATQVNAIAKYDARTLTLAQSRQQTELKLIGIVGKIAVKYGQQRGKSVKTEGALFTALQPLVAGVGWSDENLSRFIKVGVIATLEGWTMTERFATPSAVRQAQPLLTQSKSAERFATTVSKAKTPIDQARVAQAIEAFKPAPKPATEPEPESTPEPESDAPRGGLKLTVGDVIARIGQAVAGLTAKNVSGHVEQIDELIATLSALSADAHEALQSVDA